MNKTQVQFFRVTPLFFKMVVCILPLLCCFPLSGNSKKPHVVFITIDDLSKDSLGVYGCSVPEITPNMDKLAKAGLMFDHGHVHAANCTPSRNIMQTGQYMHNTGMSRVSGPGSGNHKVFPIIPDIFKAAGYHTGLFGKNSHMSPYDPYSGFDVEYGDYGEGKFPEVVYEKTKLAFAKAKDLNQPLYYNINIYDPHVKWYGWDSKKNKPFKELSNHPSRIYQSHEIPYPSVLPMIEEPYKSKLLEEITAYYNTVKRADDSIGKILKAIEEAGEMDNTIIVLVSDHGAEIPGVKTQLNHFSTNVPFLFYWPGVTIPNSVNLEHMVGTIDLLPTFCEIVGQAIPPKTDGKSMVSILKNKEMASWRDYIYKEHDSINVMRAIETKEFLYLFNPWSNGSRTTRGVTRGRLSCQLIEEAAEDGNSEAAAWMKHFLYRTPEELYDVQKDPDCKVNLIDNPEFSKPLIKMQKLFQKVMTESGDQQFYEAFPNNKLSSIEDSYVKYTKNLEALTYDASRTRALFYDPRDGYREIGNTLFDPKGNMDIWKVEDAGISLTVDATKRSKIAKKFSKNQLTFDAKQSNQSRLICEESIDGSSINRIRVNAYATTSNISNDTQLTLQYHNGKDWVDLTRLAGGKLKKGAVQLEIEGPFVKNLKLGIQCNFGTDTQGRVAFYALRCAVN